MHDPAFASELREIRSDIMALLVKQKALLMITPQVVTRFRATAQATLDRCQNAMKQPHSDPDSLVDEWTGLVDWIADLDFYLKHGFK